MRLRALVLVFLLSVGTGGCAAKAAWDMIKPSGGLDVSSEVVVGDKNQAVDVGVGGTTNTADSINIQNTDEGPGFWFMLLFALGWLLPGPYELMRGIRNLFKRKE